MARDRGRRGRSSGKKDPVVLDETLQVRVRRKNPLIERKASDQPGSPGPEDGGLTISAFTSPVQPRKATVGARPKQLLDEEPSSETTKEIDRAERGPPMPERPTLDRRAIKADPALEKRRRKLPARAEPLLSAPPRGRALYGDEDATEIADHSPLSTEALRPKVHKTLRSTPKKATPARVPLGRPDDPIPRHLLGKWGTDAVGPGMQRAQIDRLDQALPEIKARALKIVRGNLDRGEIRALERTLEGAFDDRRADPSVSPKRSLEHLINERAFADLAPIEQAKLLRSIVPDPRDVATIKSAIAVLKTGVVRKLRKDEREKLFDSFLAMDSEARALTARFSARGLRQRSALEDRDFKDVGLVSHLYQLACASRLSPAIERSGFGRAKILSLVLGSLAHPARLPFEEASDGVVGMLEFALADSSPAELTRLWLSLVTEQMRVDLPGQVELDLEAAAGPEPVFSSRDTPLRLALLQLATLAHPRRGEAPALPFMMPGGQGVDADVIARALGFLYGVAFTVAAGAPSALRHISRIRGDPRRVPPVFVSLLYARGERLFLLDRLEGNTVFLRAPHGRSTKRKGAERVDPPRLVEDPEIGLESVSRAEIEATLGVALVPRT